MQKTLLFYRTQIFLLTFITQAVFSSTRVSWLHIQQFLVKDYYSDNETIPKITNVVFLFTYGIFMTIFGAYAHRCNPKCFVVVSLFISSFCNLAISIGLMVAEASANQIMFFTVVNAIAESTSWPACIAIMSNWFPKKNISILMAFWVTCWDFGDFAGLIVSLITANPYHLILISAIAQMVVAFLDTFFLIPNQESILVVHDRPQLASLMKQVRRKRKNQRQIEQIPEDSITFWNALKTPNVASYVFCMCTLRSLFSGYFYWFPNYFKNSNLSYLVQLFDIGAFIGGIIIGFLCERYHRKPFMILLSLIFGVGAMSLFDYVYDKNQVAASFTAIAMGFFQCGPYNVILGYIAVELSQQKNKRDYTSLYTALLIGVPSIVESFYLIVLLAIEGDYKSYFMYAFTGSQICVMFIQMILDIKNLFVLPQTA